jgi:hypothetical protein
VSTCVFLISCQLSVDMCLLVDSHLFPSVSSVRMSSGKSVELQVDLEA